MTDIRSPMLPMVSSAARAANVAVAIACIAFPMVANLFASTPESPGKTAAADGDRPNILLIVADDLGYFDLGSYGGEIRTPNLDALAHSGVRFRNFRAAQTCALTRAMLMSGTDNHLAGVGAQFNRGRQVGAPGYEGYLTRRVAALPEVLRASGYHTYMAGKWHLGREEDQSPSARGFESSFAMLLGAGSHFDLTPPGPRESAVGLYREDGRLLDRLPEGFYSTNTYTDKMLHYLRRHSGDGKPFFAYLAYTSPHWPLHAPEDYIDRYKGRYSSGYDQLRQERLARAQASGSLPRRADVSAYRPPAPPWESLSPESRAQQMRMMEVYAAMVENLDMNIGRVITHLRETGQLANTLIFFMSDNGADHLVFDEMPGNREWVRETADNRLENLGRIRSFASYGLGWASASTAPWRGFKGTMMDGGIRVPAIVSYPALPAGSAGSWSDAVLTVQDVAPSFIELARAQHPSAHGTTVLPMRGTSFVGELMGTSSATHQDGTVFGWEASGTKAVIRDGWKAVLDLPESPARKVEWQLFDLRNDPMELHDKATEEPARLAALIAAYESYAREAGVVPIEPQRRAGPPDANQSNK